MDSVDGLSSNYRYTFMGYLCKICPNKRVASALVCMHAKPQTTAISSQPGQCSPQISSRPRLGWNRVKG